MINQFLSQSSILWGGGDDARKQQKPRDLDVFSRIRLFGPRSVVSTSVDRRSQPWQQDNLWRLNLNLISLHREIFLFVHCNLASCGTTFEPKHCAIPPKSRLTPVRFSQITYAEAGNSQGISVRFSRRCSTPEFRSHDSSTKSPWPTVPDTGYCLVWAEDTTLLVCFVFVVFVPCRIWGSLALFRVSSPCACNETRKR